ncbi:patatin-like phospholipase family protein [Pseudonocardia sp. CA-107938]|uniref:patatin-like phospholipase family protein n=1 Tax=Pseudonocardia sp. CA-107938 TaxID=3240021 RepID=UPI003D902E4B
MTGETVGLVLAGAAARGPYQAGALSVLLPALAAEGRRPVVLLGTSSGGISAALVAQFADLPAAEAGDRIVDTWTGFGEVFRNPLLRPAPAAALGARLFGASFVPPVTSVLDVAPLEERAADLFHPERVAANIDAELVRSLAVATTVCPAASAAARSRLFVQGQAPVDDDTGDGIDVVATPITLQHLMGSAAIPGLFPAVRVDGPGAGYHVDGGVRLNAPFRAALDLGVDRLVVISGHSVDLPDVPTPVDAPPDLAALAALSVRAILADALGDDLRALRRKNRRARAKVVPHLVVAPKDGRLAELAAATFHPSGPWDEYWAIGRLIDALGDGPGRNELISLVLFRDSYAKALVDQGRADAEAALAADWTI